MFRLTATTFVVYNNVLLFFASCNFHVTLTWVSLTIGTANFFALALNYDYVLFLLNTVCGTYTNPWMSDALALTDRVEFATDVSTSA